MFRSSDWTAAKGEKAMRDAADNLLLSGTSIPSAWDSALYNYFGKVKFSYHLASDLFRREAAAKLRDMRSPGFVSQIGTLVSIYNITPLDVIVIADNIITGNETETWMITGQPGVADLISDIGSRLDDRSFQKEIENLQQKIAIYLYAEQTDYKYLMDTSNASKYFNIELAEIYAVKSGEFGVLSVFVPDYLNALQKTYNTIYSINTKTSDKFRFLRNIDISDVNYDDITAEYSKLVK